MLLYNGQLVSAADFALPVPNRGLYFNDGFFETMVWATEGLRYREHHAHRMQRAAQALGLTLPDELATAEALMATLGPLVAQTAPQPQAPVRLRLQLWRSGGGLYAPPTAAAEWLATAQPFVAQESPVLTADFAATVRTQASLVSFCKGPNALTYVLAARERESRNLDELVLLSAAGHVAETVAASLGWVRGETIYSPSEATGAVSGVRLAHLRTVARQLGLGWETGQYLPATVLQAEAVFTANVAGVRAVQQLAGTAFQSATHPVVQRLQAAS